MIASASLYSSAGTAAEDSSNCSVICQPGVCTAVRASLPRNTIESQSTNVARYGGRSATSTFTCERSEATMPCP
jgi:hypothetical protein